MANNKKSNYLLGYGERLTEVIPPPRIKPSKKFPYTLELTKRRLQRQLSGVVTAMDDLPKEACPNDYAVALFTLHPAFIAKSYHPQRLFTGAHLLPIGSRQREIKPDVWTVKAHGETTLTTEFFVAGKRQSFRDFAANIEEWTEETLGEEDLRKLEKIQAPYEQMRSVATDYPLLEVVLHAPIGADFILNGFRSYMKTLDVSVDLDKRIQVPGLCFIPVKAPKQLLDDITNFSFLRFVREMPSLRLFEPVVRQTLPSYRPEYELPDEEPLDTQIKTAVFDGGLPAKHPLERWVRYKEPSGIGKSVPLFEDHGLAVTSAVLFGPLEPRSAPDPPFCFVDHYRVLDEDCGNDPQGELYDVIKRIQNILQSRKYDFVNLSIGPSIPVEDTEVHPWSSIIDQLLSDGRTLASVAVGNTGLSEWESGNARIQPPADCVNVMSIGASDSQGQPWKRAGYSSIGFGRSPGLIKPDALSFGGTAIEPFYVTDKETPFSIRPEAGTSFAAPNALRMGAGVRAALGNVFEPLTLKTLLLHRSEDNGEVVREIGRGRISSSVNDLIRCEDGSVHIVYQGELSPAQWIRAEIPIPGEDMSGNITIKATFCFCTEVDAQDSFSYTRSGLEIRFRPHQERFVEDADELSNPRSATFFENHKFHNEQQLRKDFHKWETICSGTRTKRCSSLDRPVFDIHYVARTFGGKAVAPKPIPYALVITVEKPGMLDLYDKIFNRYRNQLEIIQPQLQIPIRL